MYEVIETAEGLDPMSMLDPGSSTVTTPTVVGTGEEEMFLHGGATTATTATAAVGAKA
jgi:hypothetical protein